MNRSSRSGFTLVEMTIAAGLLCVLFGVLGQFVSRWEAARRSADERMYALRTLENHLERAIASEADPSALPIGSEVSSRLNSPQLQVTVGEADDVGLVPVSATLSWQNAQGQRVSPVVLTMWKLATAGEGESTR